MSPLPTHWVSQGVDGRGHVWTAEPFAPGSAVFASFASPSEAHAAVCSAEAEVRKCFERAGLPGAATITINAKESSK